MVTRLQAELIVLWVLYRLKKLAAAGLVTFVNEHTRISTIGEQRLLKHLEQYAPPARINVEQCCDFMFNHPDGALVQTPRDEAARIIALILDWKE